MRKRVCLLPLSEEQPVRFPLDGRSLDVIGCALLQKHALSTVHPGQEATSETDHVERMCRYSGAPLGVLRISRRDVTVYWTPMVLSPNRLNRGPE